MSIYIIFMKNKKTRKFLLYSGGTVSEPQLEDKSELRDRIRQLEIDLENQERGYLTLYRRTIKAERKLLKALRPEEKETGLNIPKVKRLNIKVEDIEELSEQVKETIIDPITSEVMTDPVINSQGNTYDRSTVNKIIDDANSKGEKPLDPISRIPFSQNLIIPNNEIRSLIQRYIPSAGGRKKLTRKQKYI